MAIQTHKNIKPQFQSVRPMNLYKQWTLTDLDFTTQPDLKHFLLAKSELDGNTGDINTYYANYLASTSGSIPTFPGLNVKYARLYSNETGSITEPNTTVLDGDDYVMSYN